jgi:uncharacterized membrane protein (UPF0127 family)
MKRPSVLKGIGFYKPGSAHIVSAKKTIATSIFCATNVWQLSTGLMFRKLKSKEAMIFLFKKQQKKIDIHMMFVFHPIDILFCTMKSSSPLTFEIRDIKASLMPFARYSSKSTPCDVFIELPAGASASLALGEVISMN